MPVVQQRGTVAIDLLGRFGVAVDGHPVPDDAWAGRRARELVQLLALAPGHRIVRDQVLDALWQHLDPPAAAANLRKAAHHARQALGDAEAIVLKGGTVRLFPDRTVVTDVGRFDEAAADALAARDAPRCARAAKSYGGDLLPDALYEEWTMVDRARLRSTQVELFRAAGLFAEVVEAEPTDEAAYQELMRAALATGARAAAIRWYGQLRTALARELGVAPDDESQRLYAACLDGLEVTASPFVGRAVELAAVTAVLRQEGTGRTRMVLVRGTAGIGKSAFTREVAEIARHERWLCVSLEAGELAEPYGPIRAGVEQLLIGGDLLDDLGAPTRAALAAITPLARPAPPLEGPLSRHQVVGALRRLLAAAGAGRPVLVTLDDAHAADDASLDALALLTSAGGRIVVLLAARPHPSNATLERVAARLQKADRLALIDLGPLDRADSEVLAEHAAGERLTPAVLGRIVDIAAGSPLITVELARRPARDDPSALPHDLADAITARLVDVDEETVELLKRIALVSDDLDSATVVALAGDSEEAAFAMLDQALGAGVLVVSDGRYRFRHELARRALVEHVTPHERLSVHRDAARRLAGIDASPAVVACHWLLGERPSDAIPFLLTAAQQAMGVGAFADSLKRLDALLEHDGGHRVATRLRAEALDIMGDVRALGAYDDAIAVADDTDVDDLRAKRALAQLKQGNPAGALRALEGVSPTSVDGRLAEALTFSGAAALGFIDPATGTAKSAECRRAALESGDVGAIVVASWSQAAAAHARGELRDSVLADLRDTSRLPHLAVRVFDGQLCVTQRLLYGSRPYHDVIAFADALAAEAMRLGAARGQAFGVTLRGEAELLSGALDDAARDLSEGARLHRAIAGATGEAHATQRLAELALHRGQYADASSLLDEALDLAESTDIGFHLLDRIYGTRIALQHDPTKALHIVKEAEDAVRGVLETCPGCRITFAVPAAIAAARAGDLDRAAEYEQAAGFLADVVMRLPAWTAAVEEVHGHTAQARGDHAAAAAHFCAAVKRFLAAGHPLDAARCEALASPAS